MADMDLGLCMLLVLLIYGSISQISYVGNGYVTALESSSNDIIEDNHHIILGYSLTDIHYEVNRRPRGGKDSIRPPSPTANKGKRWKKTPPSPKRGKPPKIVTPPYPPGEEPFPPPPEAPFPPPPDAPFDPPSSFPPPEALFPPPPDAHFDPPSSFPPPEALFPPPPDAHFLPSYPPPPILKQ
ncbi:hypothetical protein FRX31_028337 [Thalictrum thalictroides]|uniref:Uncharacterized protein n=1 Tax=Thalictrum thalictroides TaxID=46969 RepID=A0A7J6VCI7_THATH|nr:hypothetical protein FRX31_028337 [Thalictrum thalictroides]